MISPTQTRIHDNGRVRHLTRPWAVGRRLLLAAVALSTISVLGPLPVSPGPAAAQSVPGTRLFGATGSNGVAGSLYAIDPNTALATLIGPILVGGTTPIGITGLAMHPRTCVLYGVTTPFLRPVSNFPGSLVTIDPTTAAATVIGSLGIPNTSRCSSGAPPLQDITFAADGTLYGFSSCEQAAGSPGTLYTVDLATGAATAVGGPTIAGSAQGNGLSFLPLLSTSQRLFQTPFQTVGDMLLLDRTTGALAGQVPLVAAPFTRGINALTTDPGGALLLGVATNGSSSPTTNDLIAIDPTTGVLTSRGVLPGDMDGLTLELSCNALDAFLCYETKLKTKFKKIKDVHLTDQWNDLDYDVIGSRELCNPAALDQDAIVDPATHLRRYKIEPDDSEFLPQNVTVSNALGTLVLDTGSDDKLMVPAAKDLSQQPDAPDPQGHGVDHFHCYDVEPTEDFPDDLQVTVSDQFTSPPKVFDVIEPEHLCVAVDKNAEGLKQPDAVLLCYKIARAEGQPKHDKRKNIRVTDQFSPHKLETKVEDELCLPSVIERN